MGVLGIWRETKPVFDNTFLGISTLQNPLDAWLIHEILFDVKPDVVVEAGTYHGGSALMWALYLEAFKTDVKVITIDIEDHIEATARQHRAWQDRVEFLLGSSVAPEIVEKVRARVAGKRVLVILDSLHTEEHALAELRAYADMVDVGSYIIVQDTMVGPIRGIRRFLKEDDRFEVDKSKERFIITNTFEGYLKRVR